MVLLRRAPPLLLLLAACNQSLFDSHVGETGGSPDGGSSSLCPAPCLGDAVGEFSGSQGGTTGHWAYRSDSRAENGADYADMVPGTLANGGVMGWISSGTPAAGIASCNAAAGAAACTGLADYLLVEPTGRDGALRDPVIAFTAPESGVYRLSGQYRIADGGTAGVDDHILVSRNSRNDLIFADTFSPSLTPGSFDVSIEAAKGDRLMLTTSPAASGTATPLGMRFFASTAESAFPAKCQFSATFEGSDDAAQLKDACKGFQWTNHGTTSIASVSPELGSARQINYGTHLQGTGVIDRSGDFTIQFWFMDLPVPNGQLERPESILHDEDCAAGGGMWFTVYDGGGQNNWDLDWLYVSSIDWCQATHEHLSFTAPVEFSVWHFYRIVRSKTDQTLSICVDGKQVASTNLPPDLDLTGIDPPYLGMGNHDGAEDTSGAIDDFRVFTRALPCAAP